MEFTGEDEAIVIQLAQVAALAVECAYLDRETRQFQTSLAEQVRFAALNSEVGSILATSDDRKVVLQGVAEALVRHLDAALARVWTLQEKQSMLQLQAKPPGDTFVWTGPIRGCRSAITRSAASPWTGSPC